MPSIETLERLLKYKRSEREQLSMDMQAVNENYVKAMAILKTQIAAADNEADAIANALMVMRDSNATK